MAVWSTKPAAHLIKGRLYRSLRVDSRSKLTLEVYKSLTVPNHRSEKESNCVTLLGMKMRTEALQAHFLKPRGTNRLCVQHLVPQDCGAAQTGSSAVLETTADLLLKSSPPTLKTTTATCQTGKSLSQPSFICKKNPLTVCAARYRTNYGGNGGMYAKTP